MRKNQLEEIMRNLAGMTVSEWREIREGVDRMFAEEISKLAFTGGMADAAAARMCTEHDQIFK